jgi:hypothetical protein
MRSWYRLNVDVSDAVSESFKFTYPDPCGPDYPPVYNGMYVLRPDSMVSKQILSDTWKRRLESTLGFGSRYDVIVFVTPSDLIYDHAHIDLIDDGTSAHSWGLNWVEFYDDERDMVWLKPNETNQLITERSPVGNYYQYMSMSNETIIDRCRIGKQLTLVRTDIPHCIAAPDHSIQPVRVAVSLRPYIPGVKTWEDAVEYFQPFMIND